MDIVKILIGIVIYSLCCSLIKVKKINMRYYFVIIINCIIICYIIYQYLFMQSEMVEIFNFWVDLEVGIIVYTLSDTHVSYKLKPLYKTFSKNKLFVLFGADHKLSSEQIGKVADILNHLFYVKEPYIVKCNLAVIHLKRKGKEIRLHCFFGFFKTKDFNNFIESKIIEGTTEIEYYKKSGGTFKVVTTVE